MSALFPDRFLTNITILAPNGTTQHGNERILCLPIGSHYWPSIVAIVTFFATNYLAHAATVKSSPGDKLLVQACNAFLALLFPMSGLLRALNAIFRHPRSADSEVYRACKAGALCMVVRDLHWRPHDLSSLRVCVLDDPKENASLIPGRLPCIEANLVTYLPAHAREKSSGWVHFDSAGAQSKVDLRLKRVHGTFELPEGYTFAIVPRDTYLLSQKASSTHEDRRLTSDISASASALKAIASIVQITAASTTLLAHRSDLVDRWGYASYHLTVIPYLLKTLVNLVSNLTTADYPCL